MSVCGKRATLRGRRNSQASREFRVTPLLTIVSPRLAQLRKTEDVISFVTPENLIFVGLALGRNFGGNRGLKQGVAEILVQLDGGQEALVLHITVVKPGDAVGSHHAVYRPVTVVDLVFHVALFVRRIAPGESLLDRQMG